MLPSIPTKITQGKSCRHGKRCQISMPQSYCQKTRHQIINSFSTHAARKLQPAPCDIRVFSCHPEPSSILPYPYCPWTAIHRSLPTDRLLVLCLALTVTAIEALHRVRSSQRQRPLRAGQASLIAVLGTVEGQLILFLFSFSVMVHGQVLDRSYASGENNTIEGNELFVENNT
jgi:hypothetical protein